jgi:hypothetical protein
MLLQDLPSWNQNPAANKTWPNMKTHLWTVQEDLSSLPVASSMFPNLNHANCTASPDLYAHQAYQEHANLAHTP